MTVVMVGQTCEAKATPPWWWQRGISPMRLLPVSLKVGILSSFSPSMHHYNNFFFITHYQQFSSSSSISCYDDENMLSCHNQSSWSWYHHCHHHNIIIHHHHDIIIRQITEGDSKECMQLKGENLANYCWELCRGGDQSLIIIIFAIITFIIQYHLILFSIKKKPGEQRPA